jgi:hypothetical protein
MHGFPPHFPGSTVMRSNAGLTIMVSFYLRIVSTAVDSARSYEVMPRTLARLLWAAIAILAAFAFGVVASSQGEPVKSILMVLASFW